MKALHLGPFTLGFRPYWWVMYGRPFCWRVWRLRPTDVCSLCGCLRAYHIIPHIQQDVCAHFHKNRTASVNAYLLFHSLYVEVSGGHQYPDRDDILTLQEATWYGATMDRMPLHYHPPHVADVMRQRQANERRAAAEQLKSID